MGEEKEVWRPWMILFQLGCMSEFLAQDGHGASAEAARQAADLIQRQAEKIARLEAEIVDLTACVC